MQMTEALLATKSLELLLVLLIFNLEITYRGPIPYKSYLQSPCITKAAQ